MSAKRKGSLIVVGTGHRLAGQITPEALTCIQKADKVFHLCHPITYNWIKDINPREESLANCYGVGKQRSVTYEEMVERILRAVREGLSVCVAFYGHPGVCADPTHAAIERARREGYQARMLPGISAQDAMIADLNIDPADGCQNFEATDFLIRRHTIDTSAALILWQVGMIGVYVHLNKQEAWNPAGIKLLQETLQKIYSPKHKVIIYEATPYPICDPLINEVVIARLTKARITTRSTLYIPPKNRAPINKRMLAQLRRTASTLPE